MRGGIVPTVTPAPGAAQQRYAIWLEWGARAGLTLLVLGLTAYATGMLASHVPIEDLPALWSLPAESYLQEARLAPGWDWALRIHRGDYLTLAGIAVLAGCSILPLGAAFAAFRASGERTLAIICALEIAVLLLAASGFVSGGH